LTSSGTGGTLSFASKMFVFPQKVLLKFISLAESEALFYQTVSFWFALSVY